MLITSGYSKIISKQQLIQVVYKLFQNLIATPISNVFPQSPSPTVSTFQLHYKAHLITIRRSLSPAALIPQHKIFPTQPKKRRRTLLFPSTRARARRKSSSIARARCCIYSLSLMRAPKIAQQEDRGRVYSTEFGETTRPILYVQATTYQRLARQNRCCSPHGFFFLFFFFFLLLVYLSSFLPDALSPRFQQRALSHPLF